MEKCDIDDGKYFWRHECVYAISTTEPKDWYYEITFENENGEGILSYCELRCRYIEHENILEISNEGSTISFNVSDLKNTHKIIKQLVKGRLYPLYVSDKGELMKKRRRKIKTINKNKND